MKRVALQFPCASKGPERPDIHETSHFRKDFSLFRVIPAAEDFRV